MFLCVYTYVIVLGQVSVVFQTLLVLWILLTRVRTVHEKKTDRTQYPILRPQFRPTQDPIQFTVRTHWMVIVTDATASVTITQVAQKLHRASLNML